MAASVTMSLAGCGVGSSALGGGGAAGGGPTLLPGIQGVLYGGQQPIVGSAIQLYAANTSAVKGEAAALLQRPVTTGAGGGFDISGDYTCPSSDALVYLVATGGNPGLPGQVNNPAIGLMTLLGTCGSLTSSTFVTINELTTVAAVTSLAPFMTDVAHVGGATQASLLTAYTTATSLVDPGTGAVKAPGAAQGTTIQGAQVPAALLNTLADILAACVNSTGGNASACGTLFGYTGTAADTIGAMLSIAQNTQSNTAGLFGVVTPTSPFQPVLDQAPATFAVPLTVNTGDAGIGAYDQLLADKQGHVWDYQAESGQLIEFDTNLNALQTFPVYDNAASATMDPSGNVWVYGSETTLEEFGADGTMKSPAGGYALPPDAGTLNGDLQADAFGNLWVFTLRASDNAFCALEYSPQFTLLSPETGYCSSLTSNEGSVIAMTDSVVADGQGNVYQYLTGSGNSPVLKFSASGTVTTFASLQGQPLAVTYDAVNQRLLSVSTATLDSYALDGTKVFSLDLSGNSPSSLQSFLNTATTDGAGNLWLATFAGSLAEVSPAGNVLSACSNGVCGVPVDTSTNFALAGIAVDAAGDVFTVDTTTGLLYRYSGLGYPR